MTAGWKGHDLWQNFFFPPSPPPPKSVIYLTRAGGMWTLETWHKGNNFCFDSSSQVGQMTRLTIKWAQSDRTDSIWLLETYLRSHLQVMELSIMSPHLFSLNRPNQIMLRRSISLISGFLDTKGNVVCNKKKPELLALSLGC